MSTYDSEIKVGAAVTLGLLILVCGLIWGRGGSGFKSQQTFRVKFDTANGLSKGDPVLVRGVRQGKVEAIELKTNFVEIVLKVNEELNLHSDMTVQIEDQELMGGRQVLLDPGSSDLPADLSLTINGSGSTGMMQMLKQAEFLLVKADSLFDLLGNILKQPGLAKIAKRLEAAVSETEGMVHENRNALKRIVGRMDVLTLAIQEDSLSSKAVMMFNKIDRLVMGLDSTAALSHAVIAQLNSRDGTAGRLLHEKKLYDHLLKSSQNLDSLIADIRENPGKYLKISIF